MTFSRKKKTNQSALPAHDQIASRAYQIYLERGSQHGHDVDDWLQAEYELMQLPIRKIAELKPPRPSRRARAQKSLVALVQAAMVAGTAELSQFCR